MGKVPKDVALLLHQESSVASEEWGGELCGRRSQRDDGDGWYRAFYVSVRSLWL